MASEWWGRHLPSQLTHLPNLVRGSLAETDLGVSPSIPYTSHPEMISLMIAGVQLGRIAVSPIGPVAACIVGLQAACHLRPGRYRLYDVGINPQILMARGLREWKRLALGQMVNASGAQAVINGIELYEATARIERRWGWRRTLIALASIGILAPVLYVCSSALAHKALPNSSLSRQYTNAFVVGSGMAVLGMTVVSGYDHDEERSQQQFQQVSANRFTWGSKLLLIRLVSQGMGPPLEAYMCGIGAGLLVTYAMWSFGDSGGAWRRAGLGWQDIALQGGLLGLLLASSYLQDRLIYNYRV